MKPMPPFPALPIVYSSDQEPYKSNTLIRHLMSERDAWEARYRLAVEALKTANHAMESSTVFVNSRERVKQPEGRDWYETQKCSVTAALDAIGPLP